MTLRRAIHGILLLDKPGNITSNGALQKIKRLFNAKKAGHTGSLDPIATGMLPICFGKATKFSQFLLESDKTYRVVMQLGVETSTGDSEGHVTKSHAVMNITPLLIQKVMQKFVGELDQIPPMHSAIKFQGRPLYELARQGIEIKREPRRIRIFSLTFETLENDQVIFSVKCSKGTYVRTLVQDLGRELGCGAHVIGLHRIMVSPYSDSPMHTLSALEKLATELGIDQLLNCLLPIESAVERFPAVKLSSACAFYLRTGQAVRVGGTFDTTLVRLLAEDGKFLGMGEVTPDGRIKLILNVE